MGGGRVNSEHEQKLEKEIGQALRGLPDLAAPPGFLARTMRALEKPAPWYASSWNQWPMSLRLAFFSVTCAVVVVAFMGWDAIEPGLLGAMSHGLAPAVSGVKCFWDVLCALAGAAALIAQHLGKIFILVCIVTVLGCAAACAGFGTIFIRLASLRPGKNQL
jgi:hypothetical protein